MNLYLLHGILQTVAFAILLPLGAAIAFFRERIGPSWFILHVSLQTAGLITVILALGFLFLAKRQEPKEKTKDTNVYKKIHKLLGPIVVFLLFFQFGWAKYGRRYVEWMTWYYIHITLSVTIITGGLFNIYMALQFM